MSETIIAVIITGVISIVATIVSSVIQAHEQKAVLEIKIEHQNEKIEELKERVDIHNNYASLIPAIQTDIANIKDELKRR